jgi:hypothetical protein
MARFAIATESWYFESVRDSNLSMFFSLMVHLWSETSAEAVLTT